MLPHGNGAGIESPAFTPQEASERKILTQLGRVEKYLKIAALGGEIRSVKAVHRLRIALRRSLAALAVFDCLVQERELLWFRKKLNHLRKITGVIRDGDVLIQQLSPSSNQSNPRKKSTRQCFKNVVCKYRKQRPRLLKPLRRKLSEYVADGMFAEHQKNLLRSSCVHRRVVDSTVDEQDAFRCQIFSRLSETVGRFWQASEFQLGDLDSIHQFRLRTKDLRYTLELLSQDLPEVTLSALLPSFSKLQEKLGELNDQRFAKLHFRQLSLDKSLGRKDRRILKKRSQLARERLRSELQTLDCLWTPAYREELAARLEELAQRPKGIG